MSNQEQQTNNGETALAVRPQGSEMDALPHEAKELDRLAYEPQNAQAAFSLAKWVCSSGFYQQCKNPEQAFMVLAQGKELGMSAMQALNSIAIVSGKPTISAQAMVALVQRSGKADFIKCIESTREKAVWKTHRRDDPDETPVVVEFTEADARDMKLLDKDNWRKQQKTMLKWRAATAICREVYPDVVLGLYDPDELDAGYADGGRIYPPAAAPEQPTEPPRNRAEALKAQIAKPAAAAAQAAPPARTPPPRTPPAQPIEEAELVEPAKPAEPKPAEPKPAAEAAPSAAPAAPPSEPAQAPAGEDADEPETAETKARKEEIRGEFARLQRELATLVGQDQAKAAWYSEQGPGNVKRLRNLAVMEQKLQQAKDLFRKIELAQLIEGWFGDVKELGSGSIEAPDIDQPWTKDLEELEAASTYWEARAQELKGGSEPPALDSGEDDGWGAE